MTGTVTTVEGPCPLCGTEASHLVMRGRDREYDTTPDEFSVVRCASCGLRRLNPRPALSELQRIYPPHYHAYRMRPESDRSPTRPLVTQLRHRFYSRRLRRSLRYLDDRAMIDLLDVGCGDGWMLDLYRRHGHGRIRTFGVDVHPAACAMARRAGHTVWCGRFEDLDLPPRFDLVNVSHVIEHVADPVGFMHKIRDLLRPSGVVVVETPNIATVEARLFPTSWGAYHIPRHWTFFDPQTLRVLGARAHLDLIEMAFHPAPVHWVWTVNAMARARSGPVARLAQRCCAPLDVFASGPKTLALLSLFTCVDWAVGALTGQTSNMMAIFQEAGSSRLRPRQSR